MSSLCLSTSLQRSISNNISFCKIKIIFKSSTRLGNCFRFKDKIPLYLRSNIVYKFTCARCNAFYYDQPVSFDDFKVLGSSNSEFHLKIKESLLISRDQPILNKNEASFPLHLFD